MIIERYFGSKNVLKEINNNRELYDACRRYKYYYKAFQEIQKLEKCYWSKYIQQAYKEAEENLEKATLDILESIFKDISDVDVKTRCDYEYGALMRKDVKVTSHNPRIAFIFERMLNEMYNNGW